MDGSVLVSRSQDRRPARQVVVQSLLVLDEAGTLRAVHVPIAAEAAGVSVRTVWAWVAVVRESGRVEPVPRAPGLVFTDPPWARLSDVGGNVTALYRWMQAHVDEVLPNPRGDALPPLATLLRAVRGRLRAGRVLENASPRRGRVDRGRYDRALAEPARPGTVDETGQQTPLALAPVSEADHVRAPLRVDADGDLVHPYVTWFIDRATNAVTGVAVAPRLPDARRGPGRAALRDGAHRPVRAVRRAARACAVRPGQGLPAPHRIHRAGHGHYRAAVLQPVPEGRHRALQPLCEPDAVRRPARLHPQEAGARPSLCPAARCCVERNQKDRRPARAGTTDVAPAERGVHPRAAEQGAGRLLSAGERRCGPLQRTCQPRQIDPPPRPTAPCPPSPFPRESTVR